MVGQGSANFHHGAARAFAWPALLLLTVLVILPTLGQLVLSFTDYHLGRPGVRLIGMANYTKLLATPDFRGALANTFLYTAGLVVGGLGFGLAIALGIERSHYARTFYTAVHFVPYMTTMTAMAVAWQALLHPTLGLVGHLLNAVGLTAPNWLGQPSTALPTLIAIAIWQNLGLAVVLFQAGIKMIPPELGEAIALDGAKGSVDRLIYVTLPQLMPTVATVTILLTIRGLQAFDAVQVITKGGPLGSTEVLMHFVYVEGFKYFSVGSAAAGAIIFLMLSAGLSTIQLRGFERKPR